MRCRATWFLSVASALVIIFFWCSIAWFGLIRLPEIKLATSIDSKTGGAHEALEVFNENFLVRSSYLNPMPTMVVVGLNSNSDRRTVLGDELRKFSVVISNLSTCVKPKMTCHFNGAFSKINWDAVQCDEVCKIPGAVCGMETVSPFFKRTQPNFYNTIAAVRGYYEEVGDVGDEIARKRYISKDNRTAIIILEGSVPKCSNVKMYYPLTDWIRERMDESFGPSGEFVYGVTSWSEQMRATAAGAVGDASKAHIITLPIAWTILFATVGPTAFYVIFVMPISFLATLYILIPLQSENGGMYHWAHISPGMWISILIAMSIDYALFLLSRWREERLGGTDRIIAVLVAVQTAGKTVFLSGLILAMSFFSLMVIQTPIVQQVGVSCGILILVCMAANLTLIPALLIIMPDMKCCYKKNRYVSMFQKKLAVKIIDWIGDWPWCVACVRTCLSNVDDHLNEEENNEAAAYNRLEMKRLGSSFGNSFAASSDFVEESCTGLPLDEALDTVAEEQEDENSREMKEMNRSSPQKLKLLRTEKEHILGPNVARTNRAHSADNSQGNVALENSDLTLSTGSGDSDKQGNCQSYSAVPSLQVAENDLKEPIGGGDIGFEDDDPSGSIDAPNTPSAEVRIPGSSIWVKIATTCRERPILVIVVMLILGAPLSLQCIRFETSQNFEQLFLSGSQPIRAMGQIRDAGFNVGNLNKQYIVATLGAPRALGPGANRTANKGGGDGKDGQRPIDYDEGTGVKDGKCTDEDAPCVRKQKRCYMDDPQGLLRSRNQTCGKVVPQMTQYLRSLNRTGIPTEEKALRTIICAYDPHVDNPAFPRGYTTAYVCPVTCGQQCAITAAPTVSSHDHVSPAPSPAPISDFNSLFECSDDEGDWISKLTPCLIAPDGETFFCKRAGSVNCGLAGPVLGRQCTDHSTGTRVGAGGQRIEDNGHRSTVWGNLCPETCALCPFEQRIFTPEILMNLTGLVDGIIGLKHSVGPTGLRTVNYLDGKHVHYAEAIEYLRATRPALEGEDEKPSGNAGYAAKAFRANLRHTKSMMGSAAVVELTPRWNGVGSNSGKWVRELRSLLKEKEAEAQAKGVEWKLYFEGMAPILADLQNEMYESAPYYMAAAVVTVVILLTAFSFQSLTMGVRLLVTVAFSLSWVFGIMVVLLQDIKIPGSQGDGMSFIVPIMNVPVLVGLTLDYDLFLLVRIHEYRLEGFSSQDATMAAMYKTSGIITVAGLIMLTAFSALISSSLFVLRTTGLLVFFTCLIDTFLVRAWLVPALLMIGVEWNWWPGKVPPVTRRVHVRGTTASSIES